MKKLNLGCGEEIKKGYINLDFIKGRGIDIVYDLNKTPYPFKNEEFDEIYASHVLEHLDGDWFSIIKELYRILKRGGRLIIKVPHFSSPIAFMENHRRFFRYRSFEPYDEQRKMMALDQKKVYRFKIASRKIVFTKFPFLHNYFVEWFVNLSKNSALLYENSFLRSLFPAEQIFFVLEKEK